MKDHTTRAGRAALAAAALGMTGIALVIAAPDADAHTPSIDAGCAQAASYLAVTLRDYNGTNTVRITINGDVKADTTFGASYTYVADTLTPDEPHTWTVDVDAHDDPGGNGWDVHQSGTIDPCAATPPPTTAPPTTAPPTTVPPTTEPPTTPPATTTPAPSTPPVTTPPPPPPAEGTEAHTCQRITVAGVLTGGTAVVHIGDQERPIRLVGGTGYLTLPPHSGPVDVELTITAPGRTPKVLRFTVRKCGPTPPATVPPAPPVTTAPPATTVPPTIPPTTPPATAVPPTATTPAPTTDTPPPPADTTDAPPPAPSLTPVSRTSLPNTGTPVLAIVLISACALIVGACIVAAFPKGRHQ